MCLEINEGIGPGGLLRSLAWTLDVESAALVVIKAIGESLKVIKGDMARFVAKERNDVDGVPLEYILSLKK